MEALKKFFPYSFTKKNDVVALVINILIQLVVGAVAGVLIGVLAKIPIDPKIAAAIDKGEVENLTGLWLADAAKEIETQLP